MYLKNCLTSEVYFQCTTINCYPKRPNATIKILQYIYVHVEGTKIRPLPTL